MVDTVLLVNFIGTFAGVLAISIALALQFLRSHKYAAPYVLGLYILGVLLVHVNLASTLQDVGYFLAFRLVAYVSIIVIEVVVFYDLYDGKPKLVGRIREYKL